MREPCPPREEGYKPVEEGRLQDLLQKHLARALEAVDARCERAALDALANACNYAGASVRRKCRKASGLVESGRFYAASLMVKEVLGC